MILDVAATSASFAMNPFVVPSTVTRNRSPLSRRLPPTDTILETSSSKPLPALLAMATLLTPNSSPMADDAKTGSFACTSMMSPSRPTDLNSCPRILRIVLMFAASCGILFRANTVGKTSTYEGASSIAVLRPVCVFNLALPCAGAYAPGRLRPFPCDAPRDQRYGVGVRHVLLFEYPP